MEHNTTENKVENKVEENKCCFCGEQCNSSSQSCGICNRIHSIRKPPKFYWWERNDRRDEIGKEGEQKKQIIIQSDDEL